MTESLAIYNKRYEEFSQRLQNLQKRIHLIGNLRLIVFLMTSALTVFFFRSHHTAFSAASVIGGLLAFILLIIHHNTLFTRRNELTHLVGINSQGIARIENGWRHFPDCGEEFIDCDHPYTSDLDVFGRNSLYQWICAAHTFHGRTKLAQLLKNRYGTIYDIAKRQKAIMELSPLIDWRQNFELLAKDKNMGQDPGKILQWAEHTDLFLDSSFIKNILRFLPVFSLFISIVSYFLFRKEMAVIVIVLYSLQFAIFGLFYLKTSRFFSPFEKIGSRFLSYAGLIALVENQKFGSDLLLKLKDLSVSCNGALASQSVKELASVISAAELRYNWLGHLIANTIWLWDIQCALRAEEWKRKNGRYIRSWLEAIGELEALASLSIIRFEHPDWAFPTLCDSLPSMSATNLGHPLLEERKRVGNDFPLRTGGAVAIITGSNMSGKSTFLRSIGINLILAFAGAPVCANKMDCSVMDVYTSMRIGDNLLSNVSTFYAELIRLKKIVDAVNSSSNVLFLLDELFRGTNSHDRYAGAVATLRTLNTKHSLGVISTHDLELCQLAEKEDAGFYNFHFEEYYTDNKIHFDYKLRPGPSTTRNALYLINMVGIR